MQRIFGTTNRAPKVTIADAVTSVRPQFGLINSIVYSISGASTQTETRIAAIEVKVKRLDGELQRYKEQLAKLKPGHARVCAGLLVLATFLVGLARLLCCGAWMPNEAKGLSYHNNHRADVSSPPTIFSSASRTRACYSGSSAEEIVRSSNRISRAAKFQHGEHRDDYGEPPEYDDHR